MHGPPMRCSCSVSFYHQGVESRQTITIGSGDVPMQFKTPYAKAGPCSGAVIYDTRLKTITYTSPEISLALQRQCSSNTTLSTLPTSKTIAILSKGLERRDHSLVDNAHIARTTS